MTAKEIRICFIGESFVNGIGDPECLGWAGRICADANKKGHDITYYNLGVRRETSSELKQRYLREVSYRLPQQYDGRVVFCFGVNDTTIENGKTRVAIEDSLANTQEILIETKKLYPVLMLGPLPIADEAQNQRIANLSQEFQQICHDLDIPYFDALPTLINSETWIDEIKNYDDAHPRAAGYTELATIFQNWEAWLNWFE